MFPELLGGIMGAGLGSWLGGKGQKQPDIGAQITQLVNQMNDNLTAYLDQALNYTGSYTGKAIDQQKQSLDKSQNYLTDYLKQASQQAQQNAWLGQQQQRAFLTPAISAGNTAKDALMDSLGLSRPTAGYGAIQNSLLAQADANYQRQMLGNAPSTNLSMPNAPTMQQPTKTSYSSPQAAIQALKNSGTNGITSFLNSVGNQFGSGVQNDMQRALQTGVGYQDFNNVVSNYMNTNAANQYNAQMKQYNAQQDAYNKALGAYQDQQNAYNNWQNQYNAIQGPSAQQQGIIAAINQGLIR